MGTTAQTAEQIIRGIQLGGTYKFEFESTLDEGKIWTISKGMKPDTFIIGHNKSRLRRIISKKRAQQTIETHINKTL